MSNSLQTLNHLIMPAKKKAQNTSSESEFGTPDLSSPPDVKPNVKEPSPLAERIDDLLREIASITKHKDFPEELIRDVDHVSGVFKVAKFKTLAKR